MRLPPCSYECMRLTHVTVRSKWQHENDPTWLSEVEVQVAKTIQKLLLLTNITIPVHMNIDQIRRFKTLYSSVGLHCRYSSCKHQCVTYPSETERRNHELAHVRSYKCMECDFAGRPFTSRQDLRKHQEKYHMTAVDFAIPLQIRSLAAKSLPPLRRKTQRLGARGSSVGLSPIDQTSPSDLPTTTSNVRIDVHQDMQTISEWAVSNAQTIKEYAYSNAHTTSEDAGSDLHTTREYAATLKDLDLTDASERDNMETFGSADLASTSCTGSVVAHELESVRKLKAVHSPQNYSVSEASLPTGEPIQTATETSYENPLTIDHIGESHHKSSTCDKIPSEDMDVVPVENSTESIPRFGDDSSEGALVESCVGRCVRIAAEVHLKNHRRPPTAMSMDEEARRFRSCTPPGTQLETDAYFSCSRECWYNFMGPYVAATFADGNAIPGISKEDTETRLVDVICEIGTMAGNTFYAFLESSSKFLPQEMIRFERSIKLDGDAATDMPTFLVNLIKWGPTHLKEYYKRSMSNVNVYLGVDEDDIRNWMYDYIRKYIYNGAYVYCLPDGKYIQDWIRDERIHAHSELWTYIFRLVHLEHQPLHHPVGINVSGFAHYVISLVFKKRTPAEMVESLKEYLKPSK